MNTITYTTSSGHSVELPVVMDVSVIVPFDLASADPDLRWVPDEATADIAVPGHVVTGYFVPLEVFRDKTGQGWGTPAIITSPGPSPAGRRMATRRMVGGVKKAWLLFLTWSVYAGPRRLTMWFYAIATTLLAMFGMVLCFYAAVVVVHGEVTPDDVWQVVEGLGVSGLSWLLFQRLYRVEAYNTTCGRAFAFVDCPPVPAINTFGVFAVIGGLTIAYLTG